MQLLRIKSHFVLVLYVFLEVHYYLNVSPSFGLCVNMKARHDDRMGKSLVSMLCMLIT